ncbi:hypothetical protein ACQKWADRAFT_109109 [Trichoderma austrokoningii]
MHNYILILWAVIGHWQSKDLSCICSHRQLQYSTSGSLGSKHTSKTRQEACQAGIRPTEPSRTAMYRRPDSCKSSITHYQQSPAGGVKVASSRGLFWCTVSVPGEKIKRVGCITIGREERLGWIPGVAVLDPAATCK